MRGRPDSRLIDEVARLRARVSELEKADLERQRTERALRAQADQLAAVADAMSSLLETGDWREASAGLLRTAVAQTESGYGFIGVVVEGPALRILAYEGWDWTPEPGSWLHEESLRIERGGYLEFTNFRTLFGAAITERRSVLANDPASDRRSTGLPRGHPPLRRFLAVPILRGSEVIGILGLANRPAGYTHVERDRMEALCRAVSLMYDGYGQRQPALEQQRLDMQEALRETEARVSLMLQSAPLALYAVRLPRDHSGMWVGGRVDALSGYPAERFFEDPDLWAERLHADDRERVLEAAKRVLEDGTLSIEYRWKHADGRYRWFLDQSWLVRSSEGTPREIIGTWFDFTERREAEEALRQSELRLQHALDSLEIGVWDWNVETGHVYLSPRWLHKLDYEPGELASDIRSFKSRLHPADRARVLRLLDDCLEGRSSGYRSEHRLRTKSGSWMWVLARGRAVSRDRRGRATRMTGTDTDISQRRRAEEERRELQKRVRNAQKLESLGVLAGGIAHDFNNLLTAILGQASLALMSLPPGSPAREEVEQIELASTRAAELTKQLLAYSGKGVFVVAPVNLSAVVREMGRLLRTVVSKDVVIKYDLSDSAVVDADSTQLGQIVMNLITNASEAVGSGPGVIELRTGVLCADRQYLASTYLDDELPEGDYAYLEVSDTGHGIEREALEKLFDPFFTTKFTGRGLGLASVLGIVRGHRGAIDIETAPGLGTRFRVLLPRAAEPVLAGAPAVRSAEPAGAGGAILVADDDESVREVSRKMLERAGFEVLLARDGVEAVDALAQHGDEIRAVLLDLTMPRMDGEAVLRRIRAKRPSLPVILASGYHELELEERFAEHGFDGFIQKPYRASELIPALNRVLLAGPDP